MTTLELIVDLHKDLERQGPGSTEDTLRALSFLSLPKDQPLKIADLGCGSGAQTLVLAQHLKAQITAVDLFPAFLETLQFRATRLGLQDQIQPLEGSMDDLPFGPETLDVIWSEGAIYNMGFENGIQQWRPYLKTGGFMALSEITWLTPTRPKAIEDFWTQAYPEIDRASQKIKLLEDHGCSLVGYFYLDPNSWLQHYYHPLAAQFDAFLNQHQHTETARQIVTEHQMEIDLYQQFKAYYSYGFYLAQKQ